MKKRVLSMFMALALCLTLLPTAAWAAEDTPEGGAPAVSEQVGTNEEENGSEGDPQNTATPDAGGAEDSKADAPESGEDENAGNNADAAVSAVQTMIGALPTVSELDGMTADELDAAYDDIQAAYDAYEALNAERQAQITGVDFKALLGWFSSPTTPLADAQSGGHTHCVCGNTHRDVGDHNNANATEKTFIEWTSTDSLPTSGAYYLTQNVTISGNVTLTGDVTLCLSGHTVTVSGIDIKDGGKLTLTDCADRPGTIQGSTGATTGVLILGSKDSGTETISTASFVMYGGKITGFSNAVIAKDYSSFTMYGGSITGNSANSAAAVSGLTTGTTMSDNKSTITMYGGDISNNTGEAGGGVYVGQNCTFTLAGGKISGNTANGRKNQNPTISGQYAVDGGGGVYLDSFGKFNMTGGEISGNAATGNGGGVCVMTYVSMYNVSITGGKITGNTANGGTACGGGIYGGPAKLTIQNTEISGNKCAGSGGGIFATKPLTLTDVQVINNTANTANQGSEGGGVKLGGDDKNFKDEKALTVSGSTSISGNSPNNYYVDRSCLLPIKVSGALDENARIGICMNPAYDTDSKFLPTDGKDSVVATAADGVTLSAANFLPDSYNSDYVVRTDTSDGVKFGLCDHVVPEGQNECSKCHTTFVAVLEPTEASAKKGYFSDLSNGATFDNMTGTLKLLQDVTLSGINMRGGTPTLDLNGYTINKGGWFNLYESAALTVIDSSGKPTADRTLDVYFNVSQNCTLNLYDGKNKQGFQGTVKLVDLQSTGKLVSCGGKIEQLDLRPSNDYNVRLWQSNTQYCTVGIIRVASKKTITVSEFLKKNHPGAMLCGTKSDGTEEQIPGNTTINNDGVAGGTYKNLYLQTCEKHEPTSESNLKCKHCGAELVVKITAMKGKTEQVGYFPRDSKDSVTWFSGYAEAAAQLADWVNKDGCTDAKLFPLNDNAYSIPVTCKMTLVGTGRKDITVQVNEGAEVTFVGGEYEKITVNGGETTIPDVTCEGVTVNGGKATLRNVTCADRYGVKVNGGEAILEGGTYNGNFIMEDGTVTVKGGVTFTKNYNRAFQVTKGTLNVEGGTITGGVSIENPVNLTISGGTFKQAVTITRYDDSTTGTCSISGGTFNSLTLYKSNHNLSALLADGYAYYQDDTIVSGEATELMNVTVKSGHTHTIDTNTGECSQCGAKMEASVTVDSGKPEYYATIGAAVAALNAADGAKTLKLFQNIDNSSEIYTLTNGPVTLDLNGKEFWGKPFIAKGITLTLKSEKADGSVAVVQAVGKDSKIIANSTNIENDGNLTVREISAKEGGRLELSAGTFLTLYVVKDGSSASLSGGLYQPESYPYGGGPEDKNGTSGKYVGAWDLLPKGYRYKEKKEDGSFSWVFNNSSKISTHKTYTVADAGASFEKIYPDSKTDFIGDTYVVNADESGKGSLTLTAKVTSPGTAKYSWYITYTDSSTGTSKENWITSASGPVGETYADWTTATLTISNLPAGTYQYRVSYQLEKDGQAVLTGSSDPLTVVVTKHEHSWTYSASGATITAKCTAEGCYLTDGNGGSVTVNAPAADTLTYNGNQKAATVTSSDDWKGVAIDTIAVAYAQNGTALKSAPTEVGTYTASIALTNGDGSTATASVEYTIAKANPVVTEWPTISASVYVNSEATLTGGSGAGTFAFKAGAAKSWNSAGNKTTTVVFTPTDTNNYKELTRDYTVTVVKRTVKSCTTPTGITDKPCGTAQEELGLPGTVTITTEDGKTFNNIPVTWGGYDPNTLEEQTLTGTLDLTSIADEVEQPGAPVTAQIKVKLTPKSFSGISAAAYEGVYDGNAHGITLTGVPSGAIVKYGESADSCAQDSLTYTDFTNGAKIVYYKVSQSGYADASGSATVNITKRPLTVTDITVKNKTYDGKTDAAVDNSGTLTGLVQGETLTHSVSAAFADKNVGIGKKVNLTITLSASGITKTENYTISDDSQKTATADITTKEVALTGGISAVNRSYDANSRTVSLTKGTLTFNDLVSGETLDVNIPTTGTISDAKAGTYNVTYSGVTLADGTGNANNYKLVAPLPTVTVNITQATAPALADIPVSQKYTVTTGEKAIGNGGMPADAGTLTYTKGTESKTGSVTVMSWAVDSTGKVTYTLSGGAAGDTVTLPVTITSDNYADATVNVVITLTAKDDQATLTLTGGTTVVYGQTLQLGTSGGSGTGAVTYAVTNGTGEATIDATGKLTPVKVGKVKVSATKAGDASYNSVTSAEVEITITRAAPTGAPKYTAITTSGKTLADAGLTTAGSTLNPNAGTLVWVDNAGNVLPDTTAVAANTTYKWLFTPDDANYTTLTGSIELYHKSSSSGGWYYTYYTIKATAGTNGSISPSGWTSVRDGRDQTFTITPDKGYAVAKVLVDGKSVGAVKSYTFKNVTKDHTIEAIFMKSNGNPQTGVFVDVAEGSYYEEAIDWAVEKGITNGVSSNMFAPNDPCTRAQIVTFLWRAAGSPAPKSMSSFTDVPADAFYAKAVAWAVENGITSGTGESKFSPNSTCTRAQAVTFLYRASGSPAVSGSAEFSDVATNAYYADAVAWAAKKGITTGIGGGLFGSDNDCTRGQIVTFLWRAMAE